jgi:uncharacterized protein YgbK (DUF1537 family)
MTRSIEWARNFRDQLNAAIEKAEAEGLDTVDIDAQAEADYQGAKAELDEAIERAE